MSDEKPPVEICKGVNDLDKVVLRGLRGSSAEVRSLHPFPLSGSVDLRPVFVPFDVSVDD